MLKAIRSLMFKNLLTNWHFWTIILSNLLVNFLLPLLFIKIANSPDYYLFSRVKSYGSIYQLTFALLTFWYACYVINHFIYPNKQNTTTQTWEKYLTTRKYKLLNIAYLVFIISFLHIL